MATTTLRTATAEETAGVGVAWSMSGNITANDANPRTVTFVNDSETSQELRGYNFGFANEIPTIPDNAVIIGVEIVFSRAFDEPDPDGYVQDSSIRLIIDDGAGGRILTGDTRTMAGAWSAGTFRFDIVGDAADDWGAGLTGADVKSPNFGISLKAMGVQDPADIGTFQVVGKVDVMAMTLTWEEHATGARGRTRLRNAMVYEAL